MNERIREVYIVFKPTECWRQLAPKYETWYAWTQADNEWQVMPRGIEYDEKLNLDYRSNVFSLRFLSEESTIGWNGCSPIRNQ